MKNFGARLEDWFRTLDGGNFTGSKLGFEPVPASSPYGPLGAGEPFGLPWYKEPSARWYLHVYTYMYVHMQICIHNIYTVHVCTYICIICMHSNKHVYMHAHICIYGHVYVEEAQADNPRACCHCRKSRQSTCLPTVGPFTTSSTPTSKTQDQSGPEFRVMVSKSCHFCYVSRGATCHCILHEIIQCALTFDCRHRFLHRNTQSKSNREGVFVILFGRLFLEQSSESPYQLEYDARGKFRIRSRRLLD